jgi:RHS repeat-associated protein
VLRPLLLALAVVLASSQASWADFRGSPTRHAQGQGVVARQERRPDDLVLMNEVATFTRFDAMASVLGEERHVQDPNGSRIKDGQLKLFFDAFERLVRVERASDGVVVGRYRYDAAGRRVDRQFRVGGGPLQQVFHVHDGAQEVEEVDGSGAVQADFVWGGLYVDQLVQMRRGGGTYYAHQNSVFSVVALTDASGAVAERYGYSSVYGVCQVQNPDGSSRSSASEVGNPWRFQGRRWDPETGWLYFRARFLDPAAGRWVSRDPLGIWGDAGQIGNAYSFCGNDPVNGVDPSGLGVAGVIERGGKAVDAAGRGEIFDTLWQIGAATMEFVPFMPNPYSAAESYVFSASDASVNGGASGAALAVAETSAGMAVQAVPVVGGVVSTIGTAQYADQKIKEGGALNTTVGVLYGMEAVGSAIGTVVTLKGAVQWTLVRVFPAPTPNVGTPLAGLPMRAGGPAGTRSGGSGNSGNPGLPQRAGGPGALPEILYHGTSRGRGADIAENGFRAGLHGDGFLAEDTNTARGFATDRVPGPNFSLLRFLIPAGLAKRLKLTAQYRQPIGSETDGFCDDFNGTGSGFERVLRPEFFEDFRKGLKDGTIKVENRPFRGRK